MTGEEQDVVTAKRVFELFVNTLVVERDAADDALLVKMRWHGEDVASACERLERDPRAAWSVVAQLGTALEELQRAAAAVFVMEENLHQARRWALLLPGDAAHESDPRDGRDGRDGRDDAAPGLGDG